MLAFPNQVTFPCNADRSQDVVSRAHDPAHASFAELSDDVRRGRLEFILKDDEAYELKIRLCLWPSHFLDSNPIKLGNVLGCDRNNSKPAMRVETEQLLIIRRYCANHSG